jgi:TolB-like protein/thioredoxin-like negative regulator of GroEL
MSPTSKGKRLDSWKAIANYLGKSVRTARRWEAEEGLPVRRQMHRSQGTVYAYQADIDAWREDREQGGTFGRQLPRAAATVPDSRDPARSVVVLPFSYLGPEQDKAYIADGFTAEIISGLAYLPALRVISWTSAMTLKDTARSVRDIGRMLSVGQVVEGTVRHDASRIRVSAQLFRADTEERVWSDVYEDDLDRLFSIQELLARDVAGKLESSPSTPEAGRLTHEPTDLVAWQCLVQARQASLRWRKDSIDLAVRLLREGLAVAGEDARLHAALGRTYLHYREAGIDHAEDSLAVAEDCARQALSIDPDLAAGDQLRGWIAYAKADIASAIRHLSKALASEPQDPDTLGLLANCYLIVGRPALARPLIDRLSAIDPLTPLTRCLPGWADALDGNFGRAVGPYREMFDMDPYNPLARMFLAYVLAGAGQKEEAERLAGEAPGYLRDTPPGHLLELLRRALAGEEVGELNAEDREFLMRGTDVFPRFAAQAYALGGNSAEALRWLSVAVGKGFINFPYLAQHDPFLKRLAGDARYEDLLSTVEVKWSSFAEQS